MSGSLNRLNSKDIESSGQIFDLHVKPHPHQVLINRTVLAKHYASTFVSMMYLSDMYSALKDRSKEKGHR